MAYADRAGRASTDPQRPRAFAVCDYCGEWNNRYALIDQYEWYGAELTDTRFRACSKCVSKPQDQLRPILLPPDPVPIIDPRPERFAAQQSINGPTRAVAWQNLNGFTQITGPQGIVIQMPVLSEFDPTNPIESKTALWSALFNAGYPVPPLIDMTDGSGVIAHAGVGQQVFAAATSTPRNNLLIYNPATPVLAAAQNATPIFGISAASLISSLRTLNPTASNAESLTVQIGTGEALMQNILPAPSEMIWQGSVWVLGFVPGTPFWAWEW